MRRTLVAIVLCLACAVGTPKASGQTVPSGPLTYEQALALATTRNLSLDAARRQRAIREAAIRTARQSPNPGLALEVTRDAPHQVFTFDLPVELGGRRARRIDLATEELTLADVDLRAELRAVRRDLRHAFYSLVASDERVRLDESVLDIARRVRDAAQGRFEAGASPRLEVLQADLGVTRAETDLELARGTRAAAQAGLNGVLNLPPQQTLAVAGSLSEHLVAISYEQALALAISSNTDLLSLDRQMAVEERRVQMLRAERTPTPVFSVSALFNNPPEFTAAPAAGVSLEIPLFSRNQGPIAASIATTAQLRAKREATKRFVENTVYGTIARVDAARRQLEAYQGRLVPTATALETLAEESYRAGRTSVLGVLDAQRSLRDLTREALQAALDLQLSIADLEELLGTDIK
jgi:cobalt-zinc-cadmium efflux system outer membrane protein